MNIIIICGPPYSGKGTQSILISKYLGYLHLSTGDLLRYEKNRKSEFGKLIEDYEKKGALLPDHIIIPFVEQNIARNHEKKGIILDGYPRTIVQVNSFNEFISAKAVKLISVIELKVPYNELLIRAKKRSVISSRLDDMKPELHLNRINDFNNITLPAIKLLANKYKLTQIDGLGEKDIVAKKIKNECIKNLM